MRRLLILRYAISALMIAFCSVSFAQSLNNTPQRSVSAPSKDTVRTMEPRHKYPLYNGIMIGVNIADPALRLFGQDYGGYEGLVEVNLHNRFFPEWSFGVGNAETTTEEGIYYKTKSTFYNRIGMNYNFRFNSSSPNYFVVGMRYGYSSYSAEIRNMSFNDGYWKPIEGISLPEQQFSSHWLEISLGIRVQVWKNFYMGWALQFKPLLKEGSTENANPWYIPGYGANGKGFGFSYNLYYRLPIGVKKPAKSLLDVVKK
ncbi:MAG: DUF6048 family protein [Bacteroidales bacterium]